MIATGVVIVALGLILVFVSSGSVAGVSVALLGWILVAIGAVALLVLATAWRDQVRDQDA